MIENIRSTCCLVNSIVVSLFYDEVRLVFSKFLVLNVDGFWMFDDGCWDDFMLEETFIWGLISVEFKFVWVKEDVDCFGAYEDKGKIVEGNYW